MANKTNTTITSKSGKAYKYAAIKRKVGKKKNKRGEWVSDYKTFYGKSMKEAKAKYDAYMALASLDARKAFGELMEWFIENVLTPDSSLKESTKVLYVNSYHLVFNGSPIIGMELNQISGADIQSVVSGSKRKAMTVHQAVKLVRRFYTYAESNHISTDITRGLVLPVVEKKRNDQSIEIFTDQELKQFAEATPRDHRLRLLVILAMNTGARVGELLALTYDDIADGQVNINKTLVEIDRIKTDTESKTRVEVQQTKTPASVRSIPVEDEIMQAVADHKRWHTAEMLKKGYRTQYIFTTESGSLYYLSSVRMAFKRLCKAVNVAPRGFHTFRHTYGTRLAAAGIPIQTVSALLGHSNINVTAKYYINVATDEKKEAIKAVGVIC